MANVPSLLPQNAAVERRAPILGGAQWDDDGIWHDLLSIEDFSYPRGGELALEQATARVGAVPVPIRALWNPDTCPAHLLPWLAWALSVDDWDPDWSDGVKRAVIRQSVGVHRRKGTRGAVVEALRAAGYGDAVVIENFGNNVHDGTRSYDGTLTHSAPDHWAEYRVQLARPISNAQADQVRKILADIAPLRSHLKDLDFREVAHLHDTTIAYNGAFNYGAA